MLPAAEGPVPLPSAHKLAGAAAGVAAGAPHPCLSQGRARGSGRSSVSELGACGGVSGALRFS